MKLYRLSGATYAHSLNGMGAALKMGGARWNATGVPMIYCSEHRSLALTEVLAHFKELSRIPRNYMMVTYRIVGRGGLRRPALRSLPPGWDAPGPPYLHEVQAYGSAFAISKDLLMRVPSVVVPQEWNYLVNPNAIPGRLVIDKVEPFTIDPRYDIFVPKP
jgi:RES domain-containing protein